jgi:hypothetical protein
MNNGRFCTKQPVSVTAVAATTGSIDYRGFASGMVYVPAGSAIILLTWYAAEDPSGTFYAVDDGAGGAATSTVAASSSVQIPVMCLGAGALKAVGNDAGTIIVSLKG